MSKMNHFSRRSRRANSNLIQVNIRKTVDPEIITLDSASIQKRKSREPCQFVDLVDDDVSIISANSAAPYEGEKPTKEVLVIKDKNINKKLKKNKNKREKEVSVIEDDIQVDFSEEQTIVIDDFDGKEKSNAEENTNSKTNLPVSESSNDSILSDFVGKEKSNAEENTNTKTNLTVSELINESILSDFVGKEKTNAEENTNSKTNLTVSESINTVSTPISTSKLNFMKFLEKLMDEKPPSSLNLPTSTALQNHVPKKCIAGVETNSAMINLILPESITTVSSQISTVSHEKSTDTNSSNSLHLPVSTHPVPKDVAAEPSDCTLLSVVKTSSQRLTSDPTPPNFMPYKRCFQLPNTKEIQCLEEETKFTDSQSVSQKNYKKPTNCSYALRSRGPPEPTKKKKRAIKRSGNSPSKNNNKNSKLLKSRDHTFRSFESVEHRIDFAPNEAIGALDVSSPPSVSRELARKSTEKVGGLFDKLSNPHQEKFKPKERIPHEIEELDFIPISPLTSSIEEDLWKILQDSRKRNIRKTPLGQNASMKILNAALHKEIQQNKERKKRQKSARRMKNKQTRIKNSQYLKCLKKTGKEKIDTNSLNLISSQELLQKISHMKKIKKIIQDYLKLVKEGKRQFCRKLNKHEQKDLYLLTTLRDDDSERMLRGIQRFRPVFDGPAMKELSCQWCRLRKLSNKTEHKRKNVLEKNERALRSKSCKKPNKVTAWDREVKEHKIKDMQASKQSSGINLKRAASEGESHCFTPTKSQNHRFKESSENLSESLNDFNWITLDACRTDYEDISSDENETCRSLMPVTPPELTAWIPENVPAEGNSKSKIGDHQSRPRRKVSESSCQEIPVEPKSKVSEIIDLDEITEAEASEQTIKDSAISLEVASSKEASQPHTSIEDDRASVSSEDSFSVDIGSNIYVPGGVSFKGRRPIIIDGSNVAIAHGLSKRGTRLFSSKGLEICAKFFTKRGHKVIVFVPLYRKSDSRTLNREILDKMSDRGLITFTPSRTVNKKLSIPYDDRYIVQCAVALGGVIVSTDNFRDLLQENPTWRSTIEKRLLMFTFVGDMLIFPQDPLGRHGPKLDEFLMFPR